jgi:hypothetical protein
MSYSCHPDAVGDDPVESQGLEGQLWLTKQSSHIGLQDLILLPKPYTFRIWDFILGL